MEEGSAWLGQIQIGTVFGTEAYVACCSSYIRTNLSSWLLNLVPFSNVLQYPLAFLHANFTNRISIWIQIITRKVTNWPSLSVLTCHSKSKFFESPFGSKHQMSKEHKMTLREEKPIKLRMDVLFISLHLPMKKVGNWQFQLVIWSSSNDFLIYFLITFGTKFVFLIALDPVNDHSLSVLLARGKANW